MTVTPFQQSKTSMEEQNAWSKRYRNDRSLIQFKKKDAVEKEKLTEEQQLICRHLVRGFSLKLKMWRK